jgi:hypothetical protein
MGLVPVGLDVVAPYGWCLEIADHSMVIEAKRFGAPAESPTQIGRLFR